MTVEATAARPRLATGTTWTTMPPTPRWSSSTSAYVTRSKSDSTGGGEATRYVARYGLSRVAKLVLIGAFPPIMVKTLANPGGIPKEMFDGLRQQLAANRVLFFHEVATG